MKLFGKFLVQHGLIDEATLLTALVRQTEGIPSLARLVHEGKLLSTADQLRIFERQWETGTEYRLACVELGLWSEDLSAKLRRRISAVRLPLGTVLVKQGTLTLEIVTGALEEFVKANPPSGGLVKRVQLRPVVGPAPASAPVTSHPRPEAAAEAKVEAEAVGAYCAFFDEALHSDLRHAPWPHLDRALKALRLASEVAGLPASQRLWTALQDWRKQAGEGGDQWLSAVELGWDLRQALVAGCLESDGLAAHGGRQRLDGIIGHLQITKRAA